MHDDTDTAAARHIRPRPPAPAAAAGCAPPARWPPAAPPLRADLRRTRRQRPAKPIKLARNASSVCLSPVASALKEASSATTGSTSS